LSSRSGFGDLAVGGRAEVAIDGVGVAGLGAVGAVLEELLAAGEHSVASVSWRPHPARAGVPVRAATITVTRRSPADQPTGKLGLHLVLEGADGEVTAEGTVALIGPPTEKFAVATDFGGLDWGRALVSELATTEFESATRTFDGSIGLQAGETRVQFRVYKGRCIDVSRSTPNGPTFTVRGAEIDWVELAFAPRNDFIAKTMVDRFTADGDVFQYLRMNRAINLIWDAIRSLASEAER
jgi:hypothetical protein